MVYTFVQFHENILEGIKVIERTRVSKQKISKGHISVKNEGSSGCFSLHIV